MTVDTRNLLERHFDTAFAAPDGIKKLRELILTLAMQGKLVPQDPKDPPAGELLKEIEAEKNRLVKEGKIKQSKPLPEIKPDEIPYSLPKGWEWVRLGNIGEINPRNVADEQIEAGFVPMPLVFSKFGFNHKFEVRMWGDIKKGYTHFLNGDVGLAKITPCFENAKSCVFRGLPNGLGAGTTELHIFRNTFKSLCPEYLLAYLKNPRYIVTGIPKMTGSAGQKRLPKSFFEQNPFPLPPLPEQRRIVAKIDQLMVRCDELEKLRGECEEKRLSVHAAALKELLDAQETKSFTNAWQFLTSHFGELYTVKENVAELRKAILQLAMQGKLVPQDPKDLPASELLKEIEAEKKRLVKEGKIKQPKPLPEIKPDEIPYPLPNGWEWVRMRNVCHDWGQKIPDRQFVYIDVGSIDNKRGIVSQEVQLLESSEAPSRARKIIKKGTVVYSTVRPYLLNIAIIEKDYEHEPIASTAFAILHPFNGIANRFIYSYLRSPRFISFVEKAMKGVAYPAINDNDFFQALIPLPPSQEQRRIVAKIDQLMARCDELEKQIDASAGKRAELLNAMMAQV